MVLSEFYTVVTPDVQNKLDNAVSMAICWGNSNISRINIPAGSQHESALKVDKAISRAFNSVFDNFDKDAIVKAYGLSQILRMSC